MTCISEDTLVSLASHDDDPVATAQHLVSCVTCRAFIRDLGILRSTLLTLPVAVGMPAERDATGRISVAPAYSADQCAAVRDFSPPLLAAVAFLTLMLVLASLSAAATLPLVPLLMPMALAAAAGSALVVRNSRVSGVSWPFHHLPPA